MWRLVGGVMLVLGTVACGEPEPDGAGGAPPGTPAPVVTPVEGLTPTEYTAPDGRPLYYECIQKGLPLPPEIPTPIGTAEPLPTANPAEDPNEGKTPAASDELPPFDIRAIEPADTTAWILHESKCYGYSILLPPHWTTSASAVPGAPTPGPGSFEITKRGYQQGESATLFSPTGTAKIDFAMSYVPNDPDLRGKGLVLESNVVLVDRKDDVEIGAPTPARDLYLRIRGGGLPGVLFQRSVAVRGAYNFGISLYLVEPYDESAAAELAAVLQSIRFMP